MTTLYRRIGTALVALLGVGALVLAACSQGSEGDRCNPDLNAGNPECNGGLTCMQPPLCPEAYCCPTLADGGLAPSTSAWCQTGCNGGAASACNAGDVDACAFACANDPSDLTSAASSSCSSSSPAEAGPEASPDAAGEAGAEDAGADTSHPSDGGAG